MQNGILGARREVSELSLTTTYMYLLSGLPQSFIVRQTGSFTHRARCTIYHPPTPILPHDIQPDGLFRPAQHSGQRRAALTAIHIHHRPLQNPAGHQTSTVRYSSLVSRPFVRIWPPGQHSPHPENNSNHPHHSSKVPSCIYIQSNPSAAWRISRPPAVCSRNLGYINPFR